MQPTGRSESLLLSLALLISTLAPATAQQAGSQKSVERNVEKGLPKAIPGGVAKAVASPTDIVLRLKGGTFQVEGALQSFDGAKYVITSGRIGTLTLLAARFDCLGDRCPTAPVTIATTAKLASAAVIEQPAATPADRDRASRDESPLPGPKTITIVAPTTTGATLLGDLVKAWVAGNGGRVIREIGADSRDVRLRVLDKAGRETVRFDLQRRAADTAFTALKAGSVDIAITDRRISDQEATALAPVAGNMRGPARESVIGLDAFAVVVAPENAISALSAEGIARIFAGQITNWSELGQPARPIAVYTTAATTGPGSVFESAILNRAGSQANGQVTSKAVQLPSSEAVAEAVAQSPGAIGIAAYADMRNAKPIDFEEACGLTTPARSFTIKTEEYPLSRRIYLYTSRAPANDDVRGFLAFATSSAAQQTVADNLLVNQTMEGLELREHSGRIANAVSRMPRGMDDTMRQMLTDLGGAQRLSTTIRFDFGTSTIDSKSQADLARLAAALKRPDLQRKTVLLLGFSDPLGTAAKNTTLAIRRALQVRSALLAATEGALPATSVIARGYGPLAPVACDDNPRGYALNRRVEVWVRDDAGR